MSIDFKKDLVKIMMSALKVLFNNFLESPQSNPKTVSETTDKLNEYVNRYITGTEQQNEFFLLFCDVSYETSRAAYQAGFIAGAYPFQGEPIPKGVS
jgi:hypothetical protein